MSSIGQLHKFMELSPVDNKGNFRAELLVDNGVQFI